MVRVSGIWLVIGGGIVASDKNMIKAHFKWTEIFEAREDLEKLTKEKIEMLQNSLKLRFDVFYPSDEDILRRLQVRRLLSKTTVDSRQPGGKGNM